MGRKAKKKTGKRRKQTKRSSKTKTSKSTKTKSPSNVEQLNQENHDTQTNTMDDVNVGSAPQTQGEQTMQKVQDTKNIDELLQMAGDMWTKVKDLAKNSPEFVEQPDNKKLEFFREELGLSEFMNEFPIMCRYMVCMGQYSKKAFKRFLDKVRISAKNHPPPQERKKGYMEDQWVRRQADYVRFLWEAYQRGSHFDRREAQMVWEDAYKKLKGEFDDFRDKYDEIKESTEKEKEELKASNARDLLERLNTGAQSLSERDSAELLYLLNNRLYKKRFNDVMAQVSTDISKTPASASGIGQGPDVDESKKPVIKMIERVAEDQMQHIPEKYRMEEDFEDDLPDLETIQE